MIDEDNGVPWEEGEDLVYPEYNKEVGVYSDGKDYYLKNNLEDYVELIDNVIRKICHGGDK